MKPFMFFFCECGTIIYVFYDKRILKKLDSPHTDNINNENRLKNNNVVVRIILFANGFHGGTKYTYLGYGM